MFFFVNRMAKIVPSAGVVQGPITSPELSPKKNTEKNFFSLMYGDLIKRGKDILNKSNIDNPNIIITNPTKKYVIGYELIMPKNFPVKEANNPRKA